MQAEGASEVDRALMAFIRIPSLALWFLKDADVFGSGNSTECPRALECVWVYGPIKEKTTSLSSEKK